MDGEHNGWWSSADRKKETCFIHCNRSRSGDMCCLKTEFTGSCLVPTKVRLVKAMVFPVVMYGCESWTVKKVECQRIDVFERWCRRRLLRVSWSSRRSNYSVQKEINSEYSLEGLMLKLKF